MKGAPERIDIALQVLEGAIVFDDVVSAGAFSQENVTSLGNVPVVGDTSRE